MRLELNLRRIADKIGLPKGFPPETLGRECARPPAAGDAREDSMKEFLYWEQVQERLSRRVTAGEEPYSFYDAARELWMEGAAHTAERLPAVAFSGWDAMDFDCFRRLYDRVPVDMSIFYRNFEKERPADRASEEVITLDVIPLRIAWDQAVGLHHHDFFEIDYVMDGAACLELEHGRRSLRTGEFCFLSPGLRHDIRPERGAQVVSITVAGVTVEQTLYRLLRRDNILAGFFRSALDSRETGYLLLYAPPERRIREIIRGIFHERFSGEEYGSDIMPDYLAILFANVLRRCGDHCEQLGGGGERTGAPPMLAVIRHIQTHYKTTSLNETAELFHYEPSYLGKQIKAATGKNYSDLIREVRMEEAKRLLRTTALTIDEVAEQVGYVGRVHFFRSFRAAEGMTPGEYRKQKSEFHT